MYIDVYFAVSCLMNGLLLSCALLPLPVKKRRIWLASAVGALGGCLWELAGPPEMARPVSALALSALMVQLCIGKRPARQWRTVLFKFYAYSFLMAGLIPFIRRYISLWLLCCGAAYLGLRGFLKLTEGKKKQEVRIRVEKSGESWELRAVVDSGNLLREPVHGRPVIVVRAGCLENCPEASWPVLYQTIQGRGMMLGFWPQRVELEGREFKEGEVLIGLSSTWRAEGFEALVPESLMK